MRSLRFRRVALLPELRIHLVAGERLLAQRLLLLLTHGRPHVGVDDVRAFRRFSRIARAARG